MTHPNSAHGQRRYCWSYICHACDTRWLTHPGLRTRDWDRKRTFSPFRCLICARCRHPRKHSACSCQAMLKVYLATLRTCLLLPARTGSDYNPACSLQALLLSCLSLFCRLNTGCGFSLDATQSCIFARATSTATSHADSCSLPSPLR